MNFEIMIHFFLFLSGSILSLVSIFVLKKIKTRNTKPLPVFKFSERVKKNDEEKLNKFIKNSNPTFEQALAYARKNCLTFREMSRELSKLYGKTKDDKQS